MSERRSDNSLVPDLATLVRIQRERDEAWADVEQLRESLHWRTQDWKISKSDAAQAEAEVERLTICRDELKAEVRRLEDAITRMVNRGHYG